METVYDFGGKIGGARKDIARSQTEADRRAGLPPARRSKRPPRYGVYGGGGKVYVARITSGRRMPIPLEHFDNYTAAREWLALQTGETLDALHKTATAAQAITDETCRRPVNRVRSGPDYRNGMPVAPHVFLKTFEVYGVEFGNWQDNRQASIDQAFDALRDLAETVGIAAESIGFGGKLGLAFGARGHGKAAAHYESARAAINLTKTAGAGCLAHEWFHAWDHQQSGGEHRSARHQQATVASVDPGANRDRAQTGHQQASRQRPEHAAARPAEFLRHRHDEQRKGVVDEAPGDELADREHPENGRRALSPRSGCSALRHNEAALDTRLLELSLPPRPRRG